MLCQLSIPYVNRKDGAGNGAPDSDLPSLDGSISSEETEGETRANALEQVNINLIIQFYFMKKILEKISIFQSFLVLKMHLMELSTGEDAAPAFIKVGNEIVQKSGGIQYQNLPLKSNLSKCIPFKIRETFYQTEHKVFQVIHI